MEAAAGSAGEPDSAVDPAGAKMDSAARSAVEMEWVWAVGRPGPG